MSILSRYVESHPASAAIAIRARQVFPNGVTHDMRNTAPFPLYIARASGGRKWDVDGNEIVDYVMGHGALLLGHNHPQILDAIKAQLPLGTHYGASHELEVRWGELVQQLVPSAELVRFTSSGTEATMMAIRLARAFTGREKVLRFKEHFHGWNDSMSGQPHAEATVPQSPGLPRGILDASIVIAQNDIGILERTLDEDGEEIAAMILEPTGAHWGAEPIDIAYVHRARELTAERGILLIFDEVITGFRVSPGGAQQAYGIMPDMTTMAKILAGSLPGGCVAGRRDIVNQIGIRDDGDERQRVSHPGTFNANPLSAAAGSTCLATIADGRHQQNAADIAARLAAELNTVMHEESVAGCLYGVSSMLHIAFGDVRPPAPGYGWSDAAPNIPLVSPVVSQAVQLGMINEGVDLMHGGMMVSSAHATADVDRTVEAFRNTLRAMKDERILPD